ncbi:MAG: hypothetical protein HUK08_04970 [Bacteroidaceae bacterium]|nr:hypothetical protein [Bacteroidaceae bacterium]
MKKWYVLFAMVTLAAVGLVSCNNQEPVRGNTAQTLTPGGEMVGVNQSTRSVIFDFDPTSKSRSRGSRAFGGRNLTKAEMKNFVDMFYDYFPAGCENLRRDHSKLGNYSYDYQFISTGVPFTVYPILVSGDAHNRLGLYYYENGEMKKRMLWDTEYDCDGTVDSHEISSWMAIQSGRGINIDLPEGTVYAFFIENNHKGNQGTNKHGMPFCTESTKNFGEQQHAVVFTMDNLLFVGFEDLDLESTNVINKKNMGDGKSEPDYNDIILLIDYEEAQMNNNVIIDIKEDRRSVGETFQVKVEERLYTITTDDDFDGKFILANYPVKETGEYLYINARVYAKDGTKWPNTKKVSSDAKGSVEGYKIKQAACSKSYGYEDDGRPYIDMQLVFKKDEEKELITYNWTNVGLICDDVISESSDNAGQNGFAVRNCYNCKNQWGTVCNDKNTLLVGPSFDRTKYTKKGNLVQTEVSYDWFDNYYVQASDFITAAKKTTAKTGYYLNNGQQNKNVPFTYYEYNGYKVVMVDYSTENGACKMRKLKKPGQQDWEAKWEYEVEQMKNNEKKQYTEAVRDWSGSEYQTNWEVWAPWCKDNAGAWGFEEGKKIILVPSKDNITFQGREIYANIFAPYMTISLLGGGSPWGMVVCKTLYLDGNTAFFNPNPTVPFK